MSTEPNFPLASFREAAADLRRPFTAEAVKFKVQATFPKDNPTGALIVAYIDARLVVERLNLIIPHLWSDHYEPAGKGMWCHLTVDGITRSDIGDGEGKALVSDALKRAAVKFGVGVSLYAVPKMILNAGPHLKRVKDTLALTPDGEKAIRDSYRTWLRLHGAQAFGAPLDHGDLESAQGDTDTNVDMPVTEPAASPAPDELASGGDIVTMTKAAKGLTVAQLRTAFAAAGVEWSGVSRSMFTGVPKRKVTPLMVALVQDHPHE